MATNQKLDVFNYKEDGAILAELHDFFASKNLKVEVSKDNLLQNVKNFAVAAQKLAPSLSEKDLEQLMNAILNLSITLSVEQSREFVQLLCQTFKSPEFKGQGWNSHAGVAIRVLSNIFHLFTDRPDFQLLAYRTLVEVSGRARLTSAVNLSLETAQKHISNWNLDVEEKRELLRQLHSALIADKRTNVAFEVMMALLQTYTAIDADKAKEDARECVRTAIVDLTSFSVDHLLRLSAVQSLEKSDPKIHQLLLLFSSGTLADYKKFITANESFIKEQLKVDEAALDKKFKMLTLISLAEEQQNVPLARLTKELEIVEREDLEEFLIDAIRSGAVNGKVNEQNAEFVITSFQYRSFERPHWELLQKRLSSLLKQLKISHNNLNKLILEDEPVVH